MEKCKYLLPCGLCEKTGKICDNSEENNTIHNTILDNSVIQKELQDILNSTTSEFLNLGENA